jgi:hypothetical protein
MTARQQRDSCMRHAREAKRGGSPHYTRMFVAYARMWTRHVIREKRAR